MNNMKLIPNIHKKIGRLFAKCEEMTGVVAEEDWECCLTCGIESMQTEHPNQPYVFYHQQDAEAWLDDGGPLLMVAFSGYDAAAKFLNLAHNMGINWEWDGEDINRIGLVIRE